MAAKNLAIVCGQGELISGAIGVITRLAERLQIPVGTTTPGKGTIPEDHPLALRVIGGRGGMEYSNDYIRDADTIFFIGTNTDSAATDHWTLYGDAHSKTFVHRNPTPNRAPLDLTQMRRTELDKVFNANVPMPEGTISPVKLSQALDALMPDNAIVTSEPGVSAIYPSALMTFRKAGRRYITNYSMGALGYAVPAGLGPPTQATAVISVTGDGSLRFVLGDMETIKRSDKNVTIILTRNDSFSWIRGEAILLDDVDAP